MNEPPRLPAPYEPLELIGQGGMGQVWKALDLRLGRTVAVKLLMPSLPGDVQARRRFEREIRALRSLNHPHILSVFEHGEFDAQPFLVMEWIEGQNLRQFLDSGRPSESQVRDWAGQILSGLEAAHSGGILHRDLKPENLIVRQDGLVKIVDFGLARWLDEPSELTGENVVGSIHYLSPEHLRGEPLDARSDLFSLAAVLYELMSGQPAFAGTYAAEVLTAVLHRDPPPLPSAWGSWLAPALSKEPSRRYESARAMRLAMPESERSCSVPWMAPARRCLLVLPFHSDEADHSLASGITEGVLNAMSRCSDLRVIAPTSVERLARLNSAEIAARVQATWMLQGRLRRLGHRARLDVQLVEVQEERLVWGERLESEGQDAFDLEDQLLQALLIQLRQAPWEAAPVTGVSFRALELFHEAGRSMDNFQLGLAVAQMEECLELAPQFARAHGRLAEVLVLSALARPKQRAEMLQNAEHRALRALELDAQGVDGLMALSMARASELYSDYSGARELLRQSLRSQPGNSEALSRLAYCHLVLGHAHVAEALTRHAIQLDPLRSFHYLWLSQSLVSQGRLLDAAESAERGLRQLPDDPVCWINVLLMDLTLGNLAQAERFYANLEKVVQSTNVPVVQGGISDLLLACRGLPFELDRRPWDQDARGAMEGRLLRARALSVAGHPELALELLQQNVERGWRNHGFLGHDPLLESVRRLEAGRRMLQQLRQQSEQDSEGWEEWLLGPRLPS